MGSVNLALLVILIGYTREVQRQERWSKCHNAASTVMYPLQGDRVESNTGNGEKLSYGEAEPDQLLGFSLVSLHFRC